MRLMSGQRAHGFLQSVVMQNKLLILLPCRHKIIWDSMEDLAIYLGLRGLSALLKSK